MEPQFILESVTFSDGTEIRTSSAKIIAIVGPNNSGKSSTLREVVAGAYSSDNVGPVLRGVAFKKAGTTADLTAWLDKNVQKVIPKYEQKMFYSWLGKGCPEEETERRWRQVSIGSLSGILCGHIDVENRLEVGNGQAPINFFTEAPSHPTHVLFKNGDLEEKLNEIFRAAFKTDIILNRGGGSFIAFHVGEKPEIGSSENSLSLNYFQKLCKLPFLHDQGHGMRSFVGCTLHVLASPAFIHLLDEPEAFLHPPHAKLLGGLLARSLQPNRQLVVATHSGDFLRGLLESNLGSLCILRLTRNGNVNKVHELDSEAIRKFWTDPMLRFSNVLDAIFHEGVILCESDSDCRFYSAVLNAVLERRGRVVPDVMFAASGGKDRMPMLIRALRQLGVKIRVIADFDMLRDEAKFSETVGDLGGDLPSIEHAARRLRVDLESQTSPLGINQVRQTVMLALDANKGNSVLPETSEKIKSALKATSAWHYAKLSGVNIFPSGEPRAQLNGLLRYLRELGLFVVECGEIERFVPSIGGHGPKWVAKVLERDLANDPELKAARQFVEGVYEMGPRDGWCQPGRMPDLNSEIRLGAESKSERSTPYWRAIIKRVGL